MQSMTLVQFLTKRSLNYLSEPWIFPDSSRNQSHSLLNQENIVQVRVLIFLKQVTVRLIRYSVSTELHTVETILRNVETSTSSYRSK